MGHSLIKELTEINIIIYRNQFIKLLSSMKISQNIETKIKIEYETDFNKNHMDNEDLTFMHNCSVIRQKKNSLSSIFNECWLKCLSKYNLDVLILSDIEKNNCLKTDKNIRRNFNIIKTMKNPNIFKFGNTNI